MSNKFKEITEYNKETKEYSVTYDIGRLSVVGRDENEDIAHQLAWNGLMSALSNEQKDKK